MSYAYKENKIDTAVECFFMVCLLALALAGVVVFLLSGLPAAVPAAMCFGVVALFALGAVWCKVRQYIELWKK